MDAYKQLEQEKMMKLRNILTILCAGALATQCTSQTQPKPQKPTMAIKKTSATATKAVAKTDVTSITLEEITRGRRNMYLYTPSRITAEKTGEKNTKTMPAATWSKIVAEVAKVDLKSIDQYLGPTQERLYDGALASTITIISNGQTYTTQTFDENKPPKELESLYWAIKRAY